MIEKFYEVLDLAQFKHFAYALLLALAIFLVRKVLINKGVLIAKDNDAKYRLRKILNFSSYVIFVFGSMLIFEAKFSGITTTIGLASAGIAFALQEVIISIAGYIAIFTSNFYKIGDRVQLGGIKGDVIDISLLRTTLMEMGDWVNGDLYNGRMVRVANSFVFKEPVFNYSGDFPFLWDEITVPIKHGSDIELTTEILRKILQEEVGDYANNSQEFWDKMTDNYRLEKAVVQPMVSLSFDENWIIFVLRFVVDYKSRRSIRTSISKKILKEISKIDSIQIAASSIEIHST